MLCGTYHQHDGNYGKHYAKRLNSEMRHILVSGSLIYPPCLEELGLNPDMTRGDIIDWLDVDNYRYYWSDDPNIDPEKRFLKFTEQLTAQTRKSNWRFRVGQAAEELNNAKWYPFFVTFTIDPNKCDGLSRKIKHNGHDRTLKAYESPEQLWRDGTEFRHWLRDLDRIVTKEMGVKPSNKTLVPASEYVKYMAVIEHGKSREHHHMHALIWMRAIPDSWKQCPNRGISNSAARTRQRCLELETLWPWSLPGLSHAKYWRAIGDIWELEHKFSLPLVEGKPQIIGRSRMAGQYITKYLTKDHKEWTHRVKATRNLGLETIKKVISHLSPRTIEVLTWRSNNSSQNQCLQTIHCVPLNIIRSIAKPKHYYHQLKSGTLDFENALNRNYETYTKMLENVRNGDRPDRMDSSQFFDWLTQCLPVQEEYCEELHKKAHTIFMEIFPPDTIRVKSIKIGANEIGHT